MEFYIQKLHDENKEEDLVRYFETEIENSIIRYSQSGKISGNLMIYAKNGDFVEFVDEFQLTDYDCRRLDYHKNIARSEDLTVSKPFLKSLYIKFMKQTFPEYRQDYLDAVQKQALRDLGELDLNSL